MSTVVMLKETSEDCQTLYATRARHDDGGTIRSDDGMKTMQTMRTMICVQHLPTHE
jgi:hypothetical protein